MKILTLNAGSSSVKYGLFENTKCLERGIIERIGLRHGYKSHKTAIRQILILLKKHRLIKNFKEIKAVGHRVVHSGNSRKTILITPKAIRHLEKLNELAPLHQPHEIKGIGICQGLLKCRQFAVFDTSFYTTLPDKARVYAIPSILTHKYNIQRYGFHGISHSYVYEQACKILNKEIKKVITCHLGNGASITAIKNGKAIDTSMGFTPVEGVAMGSRSGDIDAGIITFLMQKERMDAREINDLLNKKSGLIGLCGKRDIRDILKATDKKSRLALEIFCYRVTKYIGAYTAALGGLDILIFTAGIGENNWQIRKQICENLKYLGIELDDKKNEKINSNFLEFIKSSDFINNKKNGLIISKGKIKVMVIATNEEKAIAEEVVKIA